MTGLYGIRVGEPSARGTFVWATYSTPSDNISLKWKWA